jgi:choline dehydrogenase
MRKNSYNHTGNATQMRASFDFVVVGAGSAGCAVANRLSTDPANRVLLLEAGGGDSHPLIKMPLAWHAASQNKRFDWGYHSEPERALGGRRLHQPRGRLLGGTSSINGMMYSRGNRADYDGWARMGLAGWDHEGVLPYFRRAETNWRGETPFHGDSGPLKVAANPKEPRIYPVMIETARRLGFRELDDFHGADQEGFAMPDFTVRAGNRESSATAYLRPIRARPNLRIVKDCLVTRVLLEGSRALGVEYHIGGNAHRAFGGETIICAGAFNSPQLLMLSGIGHPGDLESLGIGVRHALPAVGQNLQDHPLVPAVFAASQTFDFEKLLRVDRLVAAVLRWAVIGGGPMCEAPLSVQGFVRTSDASGWPDTQFQVSHVSFMARPWFPGWRQGAGHRFTAAACQLRPKGRGEVRLRSADPRDPPRIRIGLLATESDRVAARRMFRFIRTFFATSPLKDLIAQELIPGAEVDSDAQLDVFLRNTIQTAMHPAGTCAMGTSSNSSVVDAQLRVHGLAQLRVADTSIMPTIVSGNTSAPAIMIGEKAADMILSAVRSASDSARVSARAS